MLVDLRDPIQVHLLTETALTDSKRYEILSQEEVDQLKKQCQSLNQRIESTRANLMIQSKYRDAAISMARLYSPTNMNGKRRSILSRHSGDIQSAREAEAERLASERKCEELAAELFNLEKRLMEPQRRLLEHTAGILQLTHKASKKQKSPPPGHLINGMPGSPESLYTYSRNSLEQAAEGNYFDDANMYQFDHVDDFPQRSQARQNAIEIPLKSPIREQHQLREEMDRMRDENGHLHRQTESLVNSIADMEQRLEVLNGSLRDAIVRFDPEKNDEYLDPPYSHGQHKEPGEMMRNQLDYLETGLFAIQAEQESFAGGKEVEQRIELLNRQVRDILLMVNPSYPPAPNASQDAVEEKFAYLENSLRAVDAELERAIDAANAARNSGTSSRQDSDQIEAVLMGLWDIIQSGLANMKKQHDERRRARIDKGLEDDEDISDDDEFDTEEPYSLNKFSARVQWLYSQTTTLKNQKSVLKRQIKQQRLLNNKSDAEKDEELQRRQDELEQSQYLLDRAEKESLQAQKMLSEALEDLEEAREAAGSAGATKAQLQERNAAIASLEEDLRELQQGLATAGAAQAQLEERNARVAALEADVRQLREKLALASAAQAQLDERNEEFEALEEDVRQLHEDLTRAIGTQKQLDERNTEFAALEADLKKLREDLNAAAGAQKELDERKVQMEALEDDMRQLQESLALAAVAQAQVDERNREIAALKDDLQDLQEQLSKTSHTQAELKKREDEIAALEDNLELMQEQLDEMSQARAQLNERDGRIAALEGDLQKSREGSAASATAHAQLDERNQKISVLEADIEELQASLALAKTAEAQLDERDKEIAALRSGINQLQENLALASTTQAQLDERTRQVAALEADVKRMQATIAQAETTSRNAPAEVDSMIAAMNMQLDEATASKAKAEASVADLRKQVDAQKEELAAKKKALKVKEDELDLMNMNMVEMKTELTIAQAELDGAYGSRAERAAEVAAIKTSAEVTKLQNQVNKLKNELTGTVQELEDVTKETLAAEREKMELEAKLDEATSAKTSLEGEVSTLRERFDAEVNKARERIAQLQDDLDGERLKASPAVSGRPGTGATMLSEQFRSTMREERRKFQEEVRVCITVNLTPESHLLTSSQEERARNRKLEEELARFKRGPPPAPAKGLLSP